MTVLASTAAPWNQAEPTGRNAPFHKPSRAFSFSAWKHVCLVFSFDRCSSNSAMICHIMRTAGKIQLPAIQTSGSATGRSS